MSWLLFNLFCYIFFFFKTGLLLRFRRWILKNSQTAWKLFSFLVQPALQSWWTCLDAQESTHQTLCSTLQGHLSIFRCIWSLWFVYLSRYQSEIRTRSERCLMIDYFHIRAAGVSACLDESCRGTFCVHLGYSYSCKDGKEIPQSLWTETFWHCRSVYSLDTIFPGVVLTSEDHSEIDQIALG